MHLLFIRTTIASLLFFFIFLQTFGTKLPKEDMVVRACFCSISLWWSNNVGQTFGDCLSLSQVGVPFLLLCLVPQLS